MVLECAIRMNTAWGFNRKMKEFRLSINDLFPQKSFEPNHLGIHRIEW